MKANIFEIKTKIEDSDKLHNALIKLGADFKGIDHQVDTYFQVKEGRLKLREGNIENTLIRYHRPETKSLKNSKVLFQKLGEENEGLKEMLSEFFGIWKVVDKRRKIYFIDNVKFHIDEVEGLGFFAEIEAIDETGARTDLQLQEQCDHYINALGLDRSKFIDRSYSDMIDAQNFVN